MRTWRWLAVFTVVSILGAGPVSGAFGQAKPDRVTIAYQVIPNEAIVAKALGWHERDMGVKVEWRQFDSGRDVNTAVASGSVDMGLVGSSPAAAGISAGVPYEVIWIYDVIAENEALVAREGRGIDSVKDLVGKKVAAPFGSTTHYHLLAALKEGGVDPSAVRILDMQPPDMLAAWMRGDIDAGFVWEPTLIKMLQSGGKVLVPSKALAEKGYLTADVAVVRRDFAKKHPELVAAYLTGLSRAVDLFREKPDEAAAAVAREFGLPGGEALRQMRTMIFLTAKEQLSPRYLGTSGRPGGLARALKDAADFLERQKVIRSAPPMATFQKAVNPTYAETTTR